MIQYLKPATHLWVLDGFGVLECLGMSCKFTAILFKDRDTNWVKDADECIIMLTSTGADAIWVNPGGRFQQVQLAHL